MSSITTYENLPIINTIKNLSDTNGSAITFEELKAEIYKKDETGNQVYYLSTKDDDNVCMVYYTNPSRSEGKSQSVCELEDSCRSVVLEKKTLKPIVTQYNRILYNNDTLEFLKDKDWSKIVVQKCYEGTLIMVFNHNNKWYVTTRRCLNAQESTWVKNSSYYDMFIEAMAGKFTFSELNKNYCYHFVLVHHKNKNIVTYGNWLGKEYKEIFHILTTEKFTLNEVDTKINKDVKYIHDEQFKDVDELLDEINKQDTLDRKYQKVTLEGYVMKYYTGELYKSPFVTLKIQTPIYETLMKLKPNNSNIYQCFLELYQKDKLNDFLPYFNRYGNEIIKRIHSSMQNMAKEMLDLYHMTRNKNNIDIYKDLSESYKKCLYNIHGLYIQNRKEDFANGTLTQDAENCSVKSINVFNVYHFLKHMSSNDLRQLYYDRVNMLNVEKFKFLNKGCINTLTQSTLMFKNK
jgi:hypothetical protein